MKLPAVRSDERGSLPVLLLVITIGLGMSALLAPLVVRQITTTRLAEQRNTALNAAQAGLDMMMARVRAAAQLANGTLNGLLENLPPCEINGDAGVDGIGQSMPYQVKITYRDQDGQPLACPLVKVPTTASLSVTGVSRQITRVLTATYTFNTNNANIPGGQIKVDTSSLGDQCIDAGASKTPEVGTLVTMRACSGSSRQRFAYTADLYLKLVGSESTAAQYGMCLDAGTTHTSGSSRLAFERCPATRTPRFQWSLDGESRFRSTDSSSGIENLCVSVQNPGQTSPASNVILGSCTTDFTRNIWRSGAGVGAGMAGDSTAQLVNYAQFSRCLDVTNQRTDWAYMIAWFCKQSPNGVVDWNQQWQHPVPTLPATAKTGNIVVTRSGVEYCLRSPLNTGPAVYTTVVACTAANKSNEALQWTVHHATGDYSTSYRIQDSKGYCLTPTDLDATPQDLHADGTSKVKVAVCTSSELQKWNAPPNINKPTPLTDLSEE